MECAGAAGVPGSPGGRGFSRAPFVPRLGAMTILNRALGATLVAFLLAACDGGTGGDSADPLIAASPGSEQTPTTATFGAEDSAPFAEIGADEVLQFTGTEPFWGGKVAGGVLTYSTPEDQDGELVAVDRFAGRNGLSFSGTLKGSDFVMAVAPGECSDGMSDRTYPFTVTLQVKGEQRNGCAWTDKQAFTGPEHP